MKSKDFMPELIMLIALPGSGKSTWIRQHMAANPNKNYVIISLDDIIEQLGAEVGLGYGEAFSKFSGQAMKAMWSKASAAFADKANIIWDQTNMSPKARRKKLNLAKDYRKIAVVFSLTDPELLRRQAKRKAESGKDVPAYVIKNMAASYQAPTKAEGFDKVIYIRD